MPALSELEFGMILLDHALRALDGPLHGRGRRASIFRRSTFWCCTPSLIADVPSASPTSALVLNIEDTHLVTYSLKKLDANKLLATGRRGSEKTVSLTPKGNEVVQRYRKVREALLVKSVKSAGLDEQRLSGDCRADAGAVRPLRSGRARGGELVKCTNFPSRCRKLSQPIAPISVYTGQGGCCPNQALSPSP